MAHLLLELASEDEVVVEALESGRFAYRERAQIFVVGEATASRVVEVGRDGLSVSRPVES
jgi:hypothetical protein